MPYSQKETQMMELLKSLTKGQSLSVEDSYSILKEFFSGDVSNDVIEEFLRAFSDKGESPEELLGFVNCLHDHCLPIDYNPTEPVLDICGTGGSGMDRFNISTCAAFVLAAGDVMVAKHGNYGSKRPNGSFDFLEKMNISFEFEPDEIVRLLDETKLCFLFARKFHPAMRFVAAARRKLKKRSIFNLAGPLANPLKVSHQIIGMPNEDHLSTLISCLQLMPIEKVAICIGGDKRDELSLEGESKILMVTKDSVTESKLNFQRDIEAADPNYPCGNSNENAQIFTQLILNEDWDHPLFKHICINAALGFVVAGKSDDIKDAYELGLNLFKSNEVTKKINHYKSVAASIEEQVNAR